MAYAIARAPDRWRNILLMLVILPFWTSFLLRVYALSGFMRGDGVINNFLGLFGIPPLVMMQTDFAVYVGIVYSYLPFFILPLYTNLVKLDPSLLEASADLGRAPVSAPSSRSRCRSRCPASIAGAMLVFIPAIGEFVIPSLLGGPGTQMIGRILWDEFFSQDQLAARRRARHHHAGDRRDPDHADAARAERRGGGPPLMRRSLVPADRRDARLPVPLRADHLAGDLLVQRQPAGDGVVGLLAPELRRASGPIRSCCRRRG